MQHRKSHFVQKFGGVYGIEAAGYRLGHVIGVGAFGEVREAQHLDSRRRVAIKIVDVARFQEEVARRIKKEIDLLKRSRHRHIIKLLSVHENVEYTGTWCIDCGCTEYDNGGVESGPCLNCGYDALQHSIPETRYVTFVVQELAAGGELFSILKACGPLEEQLCRYFFRQLIEAVDYMHRNNIIHRDLKPENLVLSAQFDLRVVDFGLATEASDRSGLLHSGIGSQPYTAPEVFYQSQLYSNQGYRGPPADIWSCAVILYIMLTGKPPFRRPLDRTRGHLKRCKHFCNILKGYYPVEVSAEAKDFLMQMFQVNAEQRPTVEVIRAHSWFNGPVPSPQEVRETMTLKSKRAWMEMERTQMVSILESAQQNQEEGSDRSSQDGSVNFDTDARPLQAEPPPPEHSHHSPVHEREQREGPADSHTGADEQPEEERRTPVPTTTDGPPRTNAPPPVLPHVPHAPTEGTPSPSPPPAKDSRAFAKDQVFCGEGGPGPAHAPCPILESRRILESRSAPVSARKHDGEGDSSQSGSQEYSSNTPRRSSDFAPSLASPAHRPPATLPRPREDTPTPGSDARTVDTRCERPERPETERSSPIPTGSTHSAPIPLPTMYNSPRQPSSPLLVAHSAKDFTSSSFMLGRGGGRSRMGSSLPEANYLDNLPKRLREEKKHQNWRDEEAQEQFLLENWSDLQGGGGDLPFSMDMEDVDVPLERENEPHVTKSPFDEFPKKNSEPVYEVFPANGPLELLIQHVQSYVKSLGNNSHCYVRSSTQDNSKMLELVIRKRNTAALMCTVTFGGESQRWAKDRSKHESWEIHIRKHQGSNSDFQEFVTQVKGRALPKIYS